MGTDFYGGGWLVSSPGETAAIWIYSSTFALFWLFHFLAHSCELGRFFFFFERSRKTGVPDWLLRRQDF